MLFLKEYEYDVYLITSKNIFLIPLMFSFTVKQDFLEIHVISIKLLQIKWIHRNNRQKLNCCKTVRNKDFCIIIA